MVNVKKAEKTLLDNLRHDSGLSEKEFPGSLKEMVDAGKKKTGKARRVPLTLYLKADVERKLKALAHRVGCSKGDLIRVIFDFKLSSKEKLRKKYLTP